MVGSGWRGEWWGVDGGVSDGDCLMIQRASPHSCGACGHLIILINYNHVYRQC